jgi:hypothetical protein
LLRFPTEKKAEALLACCMTPIVRVVLGLWVSQTGNHLDRWIDDVRYIYSILKRAKVVRRKDWQGPQEGEWQEQQLGAEHHRALTAGTCT